MDINLKRLIEMLDEVNSITDDGEGITRLAYSSKEDEALQWLLDLCQENSIDTFQDEVGNTFATIGPKDKNGILIGSHLDTVKNGGEYDGALGVVAGLEVLLTLKENNIPLKRSVTVVSFRGEEANILGGTFGSRVFCDLVEIDEDFELKLSETPFSIEQVKNSFGYKNYTDYLELHIEQGKTLENKGMQIGVVEAIAGIKRIDVKVIGEAAHSGTMSMQERDDALISTSKLLLEFEKIVNTYGSPYVGTVGELYVSPNLANVVPGEVNFVLEVRGIDLKLMKNIIDEFKRYAEDNHSVNIKENVEKQPINLSNNLMNLAKETCADKNINYHMMMSGANHDANSLSRRMNAGMIFIPSKDGISHNPAEFSSTEDIEKGAQVMLGTVRKLLEE